MSKKDELVVKPWVTNLTWKQQTVLFSAVRGCDGVQKDDISKILVRALRGSFLSDASGGDSLFMSHSINSGQIEKFKKQIDHYPTHWILHFIHAAEIVGYFHPDIYIKQQWHGFYLTMVDAFHMRPETEFQNCKRLSDGFPSDCHKA